MNDAQPDTEGSVEGPHGAAARPRRSRRTLLLAPIILAVVVAVAVSGQFQVRRALVGDHAVCRVTAESLAYGGNEYSGGDHPLDPDVGDEYRGDSGCIAFEVDCWRTIEVFGSRLDC